MFDVGFWELTIIAIVGLLVIGPDKLPGVARTVGMWVGRARRFVGQVKDDIDRELKQDELRKALEQDAGLDEIKKIMNTDQFSIENEDEYKPDAQVRAIPDEPEAEQEDTASDESEAEQEDIATVNADKNSGHGKANT